MPSQVQEVLTRQTADDGAPHSTATAALTPHGKITAHFTRKAAIAGLAGGFLLASGAAALLHALTRAGSLGMIGLGLIVWAVATAATPIAAGLVPYLSVRRRLRRRPLRDDPPSPGGAMPGDDSPPAPIQIEA